MKLLRSWVSRCHRDRLGVKNIDSWNKIMEEAGLGIARSWRSAGYGFAGEYPFVSGGAAFR